VPDAVADLIKQRSFFNYSKPRVNDSKNPLRFSIGMPEALERYDDIE